MTSLPVTFSEGSSNRLSKKILYYLTSEYLVDDCHLDLGVNACISLKCGVNSMQK